MSGSRRKGKALTDALRESSGDVLRFLQRRVGADDAADLLGETMVIVWRRVAELPEEPTEARMWLFGIARGPLLNHARGERRRRALADRIRIHTVTSLAAAAAPAADAGDEIRDAIGRLSAELAEIVRLVHWDGFTLAEAAALIGIPAATARGRYARAKQELRAILGVTA